MKAALRRSRVLWAVMVVPGLMLLRVVSAMGNWGGCRLLEMRNPGLRIGPGVVCTGIGRMRFQGSVLIDRGTQLIVKPGGTLEFEGNNYVLRDSQVFVGENQAVLVGARTTIDRNAIIGGNVTIGPDCLVAPRVFISSGRHQFRSEEALTIRQQDEKYGGSAGDHPVSIGRNCWLGANSIVLAGVMIGENSVVAAGAVVVRSFPEGGEVLAGVPAQAKAIRKSPEDQAGA